MTSPVFRAFEAQSTVSASAKSLRKSANHLAVTTALGFGILALSALIAPGSARAQSVVITSDNTNSPTFNRPVQNGPNPVTALSGSATAVHFDTYDISPLITNATVIDLTTVTDAYFGIYSGVFTPATPLVNNLEYDDDDGPGFNSQITRSLTGGTTYTLVATNFGNAGADGPAPYTLSISQPVAVSTTIVSDRAIKIAANGASSVAITNAAGNTINAPLNGIEITTVDGNTVLTLDGSISASAIGVRSTAAASKITAVQGNGSTINGFTRGIDLTVTGGIIDLTVNGKVSASAGAGVSAVNIVTSMPGPMVPGPLVMGLPVMGPPVLILPATPPCGPPEPLPLCGMPAVYGPGIFMPGPLVPGPDVPGPAIPVPNAGTITINTGTGSQIIGTGANGITTDSGNSTGATNIIVGGEIIAKGQTGIKGTSTAGNIIVSVLAGAKVDPLIGVDLSTVSGLLGVPNAGAIEGDNIGVRLTSSGKGAVGALSVAQGGTGSIKVLGPAGAQGVVLSGVDANLFVTGNGSSTVIDAKLGTFGVDAQSGGTGNINISDNIITGGTGGILAVENGYGTGGISITGTGDVTGTTGNAIDAQIIVNAFQNKANGSNIRIDRRGVITGGAIGVSATTQGTGEIYVSTDVVSGAAGQGILASGALSTLVTVVANGNVTGTTTGIDALGSGDTIVTLNSGTTKGGVGVSAVSNSGNAGIALVSGAAIMGTSGNGATVTAANGVNVLNNGAITGADVGLKVTASGANGLFISGSGTFAGQGTEGINANNLGSGVTGIDITGAVVGKASGLFVRDTTAGGDITIKAGAVSGSTGIDAVSVSNAGNISITGNGAVVGTAGIGIFAGISNAANASNITINRSGSVSGTQGIVANSSGKGNVSVTGTGTGTVTGTGQAGVDAFVTGGGAGTVKVDVAQNVMGTTVGLRAATDGGGNVTLTAGGNVTATAGIGLTALNTGALANAGTITVTTATGKLVSATGNDGIRTNSGASTGLTTITANGNITSTDKTGINANSNGGGVTITQAAASTITGAVDAIKVNNGAAGGAIIVNALGTLTANNGSGVFVNTTSATADPITVTTNIVKSTGAAGTWGSQVRASAGTGDIIINSNGAMGSAGAPSSIFGGILASTTAASNRNVTVNVNADIGTATDRNAAAVAQVQVGGTSSTMAKTLAVNINNASIYGAGGAVLVSHGATSLGDIKITGTGAGTLSATGAIGVSARILNAANTGNVLVDLTQSVSGSTSAINATTVGKGGVTVNAGAAITSGTGQGIFATSGGGDVKVTSVAVTSTGNTGVTAQLAGASTATGTITATTNGAVSGTRGISTFQQGVGDVTVNANANVTATAGDGISATQTGIAGNAGKITVNQAAGTLLNATGNGIITSSGSSAGATTINVNGEIKATGGAGIKSTSTTGAIITNIAAGAKVDPVIGVDQTTVSGVLTVNNAGFVEGDTIGVRLESTGAGAVGALTVAQTGTGAINGKAAQGIRFNAGNANVVVTGNGASTTITGGSIGIDAQINGNGTISISDNTITGVNNGIVASTNGTGGISITGAGNVSGGTSTGLFASISNAASASNVTINRSGNVSGTDGVFAQILAGTGNVGVTVGGTVTATAGTGITAAAVGGTNMVSTLGNVIGTTGGILATNSGAGATNITTAAGTTVSTTGGVGIRANNVASTGAVTILAGSNVSALGVGVSSFSNGGDATITTNGTVTSTGDDAISAQNNGATGKITVNANAAVVASGTVAGFNDGIQVVQVNAAGTGAVAITTGVGGTITANGNGISSRSNAAISGNTDIVVGGAINAVGSGINANGSKSGAVNVTTNAAVTSTGSSGIITDSANGNQTVITNATVTGASRGIYAGFTNETGVITVTTNAAVIGTSTAGIQVDGLGNLIVNGTGTVSSANGTGIIARSFGASNANVTQGGTVSGKLFGVSATTNGTGNLIVATLGNVTATGGVGISATNTNAAANAGTITVTTAAGKLVTATGGNGITTNSGLSTGATIINVNGEVTAPGQTGVKATSTAGSITLNVSATGKIDPIIGTEMTTAAGVLTINNAGLIMGDTTGAKLTATGTGSVAVVNTGTVTGGTDAVLGSAAGTAFNITSSGTLNGGVNVTGSSLTASTFNNSGVWNAGAGMSSYAGVLNNTGTINVATGGSVLILGTTNITNRVNLAGTSGLNAGGAMVNTGIINAQNGIIGNVVTVAGTYTGGGQFLVDANTATATADVMRITGAASGNTNVGVSLIGRGFLASGFLPIVFVTPGAAAGTFTSNTVFSSGILTESFGQNPANSGQFGLLQSFNPNTAQLAGLSTIASSVSNFIDEPTSVYVTAKANPSAGDHQFGFWGRGGAGNFNQNLSTAFSTGATGLGTVTRRVSTNYQMLQAGFDYGMLNMGGKGWNLHLGITGGNMDSSARETAGSVQYDASFVGGYAFLSNGAFTLDGGLRREWRNFKIFNQTVLGNASPVSVKGRATAGSVSASYRIGAGTGFALTPSASLNFSDGNIDSFAVDALTRYSPGSDKSLVGRAGARLSYKMQPRGSLILEEYVGVHALRNFSNLEASSVLFTGATTTNFGALTTAYRDAMQYSAGIKATNETGRIGAFIEGNWNSGNGVEGGSMSIGARVNF